MYKCFPYYDDNNIRVVFYSIIIYEMGTIHFQYYSTDHLI